MSIGKPRLRQHTCTNPDCKNRGLVKQHYFKMTEVNAIYTCRECGTVYIKLKCAIAKRFIDEANGRKKFYRETTIRKGELR